jgi:hypothetical protein
MKVVLFECSEIPVTFRAECQKMTWNVSLSLLVQSISFAAVPDSSSTIAEVRRRKYLLYRVHKVTSSESAEACDSTSLLFRNLLLPSPPAETSPTPDFLFGHSTLFCCTLGKSGRKLHAWLGSRRTQPQGARRIYMYCLCND